METEVKHTYDPTTVRDQQFQERLALQLQKVEAVRAHHTFLGYAKHQHLFAELETIYQENLAAYERAYAQPLRRLQALQQQLTDSTQPLHPAHKTIVQQLLTQIEATLTPHDYQVNRTAIPLLDQAEAEVAQAQHTYQAWEKDLASWRMELKAVMNHVWAEDYQELKNDYQQQKSLLQGETLPRSPLGPIPAQITTAKTQRAEAEQTLLQGLRFHPRLKKQAEALQNRYLPQNQFDSAAKKLRQKAIRRRAISLVGITLLAVLGAAGAWYIPQWQQAQAEAEAWAKAQTTQTLQGYQQYLTQFPNGLHTTEAVQSRNAIREGKLTLEARATGVSFDYDGALRQALPHGYGRATFSDSSYYEGYWKAGNRDSIGTMVYANGDRYQGNWEADKPEGQGRMQFANGDQYEGNWKNGQFQGWGAYTGKNGRSYRGGWQAGQPQGKGVYTYADGSVYDGYWQNGLYHGHGQYSSPIGTVYLGNWQQGKRQGQGQLSWANGARFSGTWAADSIAGQGVFVNRFRQQLEGNWQGLPEGIKLYDAAGNLLQQGRWIDGLFLSVEP